MRTWLNGLISGPRQILLIFALLVLSQIVLAHDPLLASLTVCSRWISTLWHSWMHIDWIHSTCHFCTINGYSALILVILVLLEGTSPWSQFSVKISILVRRDSPSSLLINNCWLCWIRKVLLWCTIASLIEHHHAVEGVFGSRIIVILG